MPSFSPCSYNYLDDVPDSLFEVVVTLGVGELQQRCESLLYWRQSLLKGQLPRLFSWPSEADYKKIINALETDKKYQLCLNNVALSDYCCLQILLFLDANNEELILLLPDKKENKPSATDALNSKQEAPAKNETKESHRETPAEINKNALKASQQQLNIQASENSGLKNDLEKLFKHYAIERRLGFDLNQGLLQRQAWKEILRCHQTIKHSAWLQNIIQQLGRVKEVKAKVVDDKSLYLKSHSSRRQLSSHRTIQAPMEMRGIERNDDVGRMLPSELSMLGHAKLKMLWHIRRAERMLLSYEVDGVLSEHIPVYEKLEVLAEKTAKLINHQQGPVIIILDTSASMQGKPEHVAKAIVLESLRVCRQQQRLCYLFLFSGEDEIQQIVLDASKQSWLKVLDLMQFSFHGGTQVEPVTLQALLLLQQKKWRQADILIVSDGRYSVSENLQEKINETRLALALNLWGINVGAWKDHAMQLMCDKVYRYPRLSK